MADYGIRILPRALNGPLWMVSPRALRMWLFLAARAQHAPITRIMPDGQRIRIDRGQWLTSARKLRGDGMGSLSSVTSALAELERAGVITVQSVPRSKNQNGGVPKIRTGAVPKNGTQESVMASLVTVCGQPVTADPVPKNGTKEVQSERLSPLSRREREEWDRAERILAAEGR